MRKITFEVESANVVNDDPTSQFATAKILAFSSGYSRNGTYATPENLRKTAHTIYEKPIIFEMSPYFNDFGSHSKKTVPAGFVVPNSAEFVEQEDGRLGLSVMAKIWKRYSGKFMDIFKESKNKQKKVSVEMELLEEKEMEDGTAELINWVYGAICLLGDMVLEGSKNANMKMVSFAQEYQSDYLREFGMRYDGIDFSIPEDVKEIVKMGLEKEVQNAVVLAGGRYLMKNSTITPDKARHIYKNIMRSKKAERKDEYEVFGGSACEKWLSAIVSQMEQKDNERMTMFEDFSKKEVNQSMEDDNKEKVEMEVQEPETNEPEKQEMAVEEPEKEEEPKEESPSEEKPEDGEKEEENKEFSLDAYLDVAATLAFLEEETETFTEMKDEEDDELEMACKMAVEDLKEKREFAEPQKVFKAMFAKAKAMKKFAMGCKMQAEKFAKENEELKQFKANVESQQMQYEIDVTMKEVESTMPKEEYEAAKEDSKNFSLETINIWKNKVFAKAYTFAKNVKPDNGVKIYALPWADDNGKKSNDGWTW